MYVLFNEKGLIGRVNANRLGAEAFYINKMAFESCPYSKKADTSILFEFIRLFVRNLYKLFVIRMKEKTYSKTHL